MGGSTARFCDSCIRMVGLRFSASTAVPPGARQLTCVLHLHVGEGLQRVLEGDAVQVERPDAIVHLLGVADELVCQLADLIRTQVPTQPVHGTDRRRVSKHHLT